MDATADPELYTTLDTATPERPPLRREEVYGELRRRILMGEFPTRTRLAEERIAALLGVSRTPVREALVRLLTDRLVSHDPERGYFVAEPDLLGLRDLYEVRVA